MIAKNSSEKISRDGPKIYVIAIKPSYIEYAMTMNDEKKFNWT